MTLRAIDVGDRPRQPAPASARPELRWVALADLVVDDRYQRPMLENNWRAVERIAARFDWAKFQPLLVAPLDDGRFAVIDGQHRAHAAALCGLRDVPCAIVDLGLAGQAQAFAAVNSAVIRITPLQVFKAALAAGEPWAVQAEAAVSAAGARLMTFSKSGKDKKAGEVFCVGRIRAFVEKGEAKAVERALRALREFDHDKRAALWTEYILIPWIKAVAMLPGASDRALVAALLVRDPFKVIEGYQGPSAGVERPRAFRAMIAGAEARL